jgi:hypothetical protein
MFGEHEDIAKLIGPLASKPYSSKKSRESGFNLKLSHFAAIAASISFMCGD